MLVHNECKNAWNQYQQDHKHDLNPETGKKYTRSELAAKYRELNPQNGHYLHRPYLRKKTRDEIKAKLKTDSKGRKYDVIGRKWLEPDAPMDIGHVNGHEFWYERMIAEQKGLTQAEFNDHMNNSEFYAYQDMHENRAHIHEATH